MTAQSLPNIVFILADNVGWGDCSAYNGTVPTPRIDSIARDGIRFDNYNVEAQCTPTRAAILTGRMPIRSGTSTVPLPGQGPYGLSPWEYTIANLLSDAGYSTALFHRRTRIHMYPRTQRLWEDYPAQPSCRVRSTSVWNR